MKSTFFTKNSFADKYVPGVKRCATECNHEFYEKINIFGEFYVLLQKLSISGFHKTHFWVITFRSSSSRHCACFSNQSSSKGFFFAVCGFGQISLDIRLNGSACLIDHPNSNPLKHFTNYHCSLTSLKRNYFLHKILAACHHKINRYKFKKNRSIRFETNLWLKVNLLMQRASNTHQRMHKLLPSHV